MGQLSQQVSILLKKKVAGLNAKGYVAKRANITGFNSIVFSVVGDVFIDNKVPLKDLSAQSSKMLIEIGFCVRAFIGMNVCCEHSFFFFFFVSVLLFSSTLNFLFFKKSKINK
jgi:hypothetical protein